MGRRDRRGKTALHHAAEAGSRTCVSLLLEAGADSLAQDTMGGRTPLHLAAWHRRERAVAKLLALGDQRQYHVLDGMLGRAPLHLAAWQGDLRIVQLLLKVRVCRRTDAS